MQILETKLINSFAKSVSMMTVLLVFIDSRFLYIYIVKVEVAYLH